MPASKYRAAKKKIKTKKKAQAKQYKTGAKLVVKGKKQAAKAATQASKGVSKLRKSGELKSGPKKSTRYKAGDAAHKISSGTKMMDASERGQKASKVVGMKRRGKGEAIGRAGKSVSRRGKVKK